MPSGYEIAAIFLQFDLVTFFLNLKWRRFPLKVPHFLPEFLEYKKDTKIPILIADSTLQPRKVNDRSAWMKLLVKDI